MTTLRNIPAIRKAAEVEARVRQDALADRWPSMDNCPPPTWASMGRDEQEFLIDVEADLLADLTRPPSRDAVARLVAERVPGLQAWEVVAGCECGGGRLQMVLRYCGMPMLDRWEPDPTPVEALSAIALHVLTEPA